MKPFVLTAVDNPLAPDIFADACAGIYIMNGTMKMTLESCRSNHGAEQATVNRVVIGRIVMPIVAAEAMARAILEEVDRRRHSPTATLTHRDRKKEN